MTETFEEEVRQGQVVCEDNQHWEDIYRAVFVGKNLYLYKAVKKGLGYRGNTYPCDGYTLAWSDCSEYKEMPQQFVSLKRS